MTATSQDLPKILADHVLWIRGKGGCRADLGGADLRGANLRDANLGGANLRDANLGGAKNSERAIAMTRILPEGELIVWKKLHGGIIAKLKIPSEAKRSHAFGRKCRAEFAEVLELSEGVQGRSQHDRDFIYSTGAIVRPHLWDENWQEECAGGIHFYITRIEAENHV